MSLEQLGKEVQAFVKESQELTTSFKKHKEDLQKKIDEGRRGSVEVREELSNMENNIYSDLADKVNKIQEKIESVRELELNQIEESNAPITSDTVAELNLISQLNLTSDELGEYFIKYKRSPLAIKRLKEIASSKQLYGATAFAPEDRKERLNIILGRMDNHLIRFKRPDFNEYGVKIGIIAEGAINGINEDVAAYRSL